MTDFTPIQAAAYEYLSDRHTTLWADFDISEPERREQAARWLALQVEGVQRVLDS